MNLFLKTSIQKVFNALGYQLRKADNGVSYTDPYQEQKRILQNTLVSTIFEVGAADGRDCILYTQLFPDAKVYAFEPLPTSYAKIVESAKINKAIIPFNLALSSTKGTATFYQTELEDASSLLESQETGSTFDIYTKVNKQIQVETTTLDNLMSNLSLRQIDILKMDAQGAELLILNGSLDTIKNNGIKLIFMEVNFIQIYKGMSLFHDIAAFLVKHGFKLHNLYDFNHNQKGEITWADAIFIRK